MMPGKLLLTLVVAAAGTYGYCSSVGAVGSASDLPLVETTQIPGEVLKPGEYTISVVDRLADRMIVRVDSKAASHHALFLAVQGTVEGAATGPVLWKVGLHKTSTMRGFKFANGQEVEFVYPKAEAAALAQANASTVVAIDPQSEGRAPLKNLSADEMQAVNLWMLSLTTTGVGNKIPAILAQRYEPRPDIHPVVVATSEPVRQPESQRETTSVQAPSSPQLAVVQQKSGGAATASRRKAIIAQLPHTGSNLPLVWLAMALSFFGVTALRFTRASARPSA